MKPERLTADVYEIEGRYEICTLKEIEGIDSPKYQNALAIVTFPNSPAYISKLKTLANQYNLREEKSLKGLEDCLKQNNKEIEVISFSNEEISEFEKRLKEIADYGNRQ